MNGYGVIHLSKLKKCFIIKLLISVNIIMSTPRRKLGDLGEKIAREYLEKQNYKIIDLNWQKQWGEIDIIARENNRKGNKNLVFIEVKTRNKLKNRSYGLPEDAVNFFKRKKIIQTARNYLFKKHYPEDTNWRIDVIAIEINEENHRANLRHMKSAVD